MYRSTKMAIIQRNDFQKKICEDIMKPKGSCCYSSSLNKQNCLLLIFIQKKKRFSLYLKPSSVCKIQNTHKDQNFYT